ncbi:hypothetical protein E5F05_06130 [Deinococcus metallilatus]|uniref:Uncharacterized protein n=1 Tax=Deinococcus metallilatus TaxID=1211322 RepID=A0AAJ5K0Q4_9DEIO|nr:hypothetical protein [Deinococcus metallilatus]MBB5294518.1 hypothetical protein [Deinococcus metallilatus]QBY07567.1 hypothetical protein E5F05_06130 [Deinococcus metallilatus]TLK29948.1 hypothetical protein FCS05_05280 [Deinococcus metallilatus]
MTARLSFRREVPMFDNAQSFVIKVWLERAAPGGRRQRASWRGQITHVPGGECQAVRRLDEITEVIAAFLERSGVDPGQSWRWWHRWKRLVGRATAGRRGRP